MVTDFKKNRNKSASARLLLAFGGIVIVAIVLLLIIADVRVYQKKKQLNDQVMTLENKIKDLQKKNNALKEGIENADKQAYIEKVAREELNLQKPGEKVVSFVTSSDEKKDQHVAQKGIVGAWLAWLAGLFK